MNEVKEIKNYKNILYEILKIISIVIIVPIIIYNMTLMIKSIVNSDENPSFFGVKSFVIISESMEPNINKEDAIFVKEVPSRDLKIGDVISFKDDGFINTHRIVEVINENGTIKYRTKGDNNLRNDVNLVDYSNVEGKYIFRLPGFGNFIEFIKDRNTLVILLCLLVFILMYQISCNKKILEENKRKYENDKKNLEKLVPQKFKVKI